MELLADHWPTSNSTKFQLKMYNRYTKLKVLEGFIGNIVSYLKKAAPRFELGIKDLQSSALPLGDTTEYD